MLFYCFIWIIGLNIHNFLIIKYYKILLEPSIYHNHFLSFYTKMLKKYKDIYYKKYFINYIKVSLTEIILIKYIKYTENIGL